MITNILDYLENSGKLYPDKAAFIDDIKAVSYNELINKARSIGTSIAKSTNSDIRKPVVVLVDRNIESIISFMGVVYSGNFYVPVDSKMPLQRIELIYSVLNPIATIAVSSDDLKLCNAIEYPGLILKYEDIAVSDYNHELLSLVRLKTLDIDPLYTIFTSGSTGVPKGVIICQKSVIDLAEWLVETFEFTDKDILGNQTPFYFDASVKDIYITMKTGATMRIITRKYFLFPKMLIDYLNENKITTILWATSAVCLLANSDVLEQLKLKYLNKIFFAGEQMPAKQLNIWKKYLPNARYINLYGPTEITVDCTYYVVNRDLTDDEYVPIGVPCKNKGIIILDENNHPVHKDQIGELCVRGTGLALGYYNNPEKTEEVFIQNPMHNFYKDILYKTGDLVKYNDRNEIVFVSRKDFQIKHMGNRIELGEIEVAVYSIYHVTNAACIYDSENRKIILFYTTDDGKSIDIINNIKTKVPKYMFPNVNIHTLSLPYNSNGKIDRLALNEQYKDGKNI